MKRIVICGVMCVLAASSAFSVLADPPGDRRAPGGARPSGPPSHGPGRPGGGEPPRPSRPEPGGRPPSTSPPHGQPPRIGHPRPTPAPGHHRPSPAPGHHRPTPAPGHRPVNRPIYGWNHHRLRLGQFRYPQGYGYRSWSVGQSLPQLLFSSAYYFTDYAALGLDSPPWGYQWVRYGPDVLLVNIRTGEILDVIHNAFY